VTHRNSAVRVASSFVRHLGIIGSRQGDRTRNQASTALGMEECLKVEVTLDAPGADAAEFDALSAIVGETLASIAALPVLPSEAEDILASATNGSTTVAFRAREPKR